MATSNVQSRVQWGVLAITTLAAVGCATPNQDSNPTKSAYHQPSSMPEFEVLPSAMPFLESEGAPRLNIVLATSLPNENRFNGTGDPRQLALWQRGFWTCQTSLTGQTPYAGTTCSHRNNNRANQARINIAPWAHQYTVPEDPWAVQGRWRSIAEVSPQVEPRRALFLPVRYWVQASRPPAYALITSPLDPQHATHKEQSPPIQLGKIKLCNNTSDCEWTWVFLENWLPLSWIHAQPLGPPLTPGAFQDQRETSNHRALAHQVLQTMSLEAEALPTMQSVLGQWPKTVELTDDALDLNPETFERITNEAHRKQHQAHEARLFLHASYSCVAEQFFCFRRAFVLFHALADALRLVEEIAHALPGDPGTALTAEMELRFPDRIISLAQDLASTAPSNAYELGVQFLRDTATHLPTATLNTCTPRPQWSYAVARANTATDTLLEYYGSHLTENDREIVYDLHQPPRTPPPQQPTDIIHLGTAPPPLRAAVLITRQVVKHVGARLQDRKL